MRSDGRKTTLFCAVLAVALLFSACAARQAGVTPGDAALPVVPTDAPVVLVEGKDVHTPRPTDTPTPTPTLTPRPTPKASLTTGRMLDGDRPFRPVLVVIGNAPKVRPQAGLMQADIIYETAMERSGNETRFIALYSDTYPAAVGPVQSARVFDARLLRDWNSPLIYSGYPDEEAYPEFDDSDVLLSGEYTKANDDYFFTDNVVNSEPQNMLFCLLPSFVSAIYGDHEASALPHFLFQSNVAYSYGKPAKTVCIPFAGSDYGKIEFRYNAEENRYYRFERNSKELLTANKTRTPNEDASDYTTEPVSVQNVIVQYVRYPNLDATYREAVLTGTGKCEYFINGLRVSGTWSRDALTRPTSYLLNDGAPVVLEPGTTWIVLQPATREIKVRAK